MVETGLFMILVVICLVSALMSLSGPPGPRDDFWVGPGYRCITSYVGTCTHAKLAAEGSKKQGSGTFRLVAILCFCLVLSYCLSKKISPSREMVGLKLPAQVNVPSWRCSLKGFMQKWIYLDNYVDNFKFTKAGKFDMFAIRSSFIPETTFFVAPTSIDNYYRELTDARVSKTSLMRYEWARFESFQDLPASSPVMATRLASAGFYSSGTGDESVCFVCERRYRGWKQGDVPLDVHQRISPDCAFVTGRDETNIPIHDSVGLQQETTVARQSCARERNRDVLPIEGATRGSIVTPEVRAKSPPKHPNYATQSLRESSFERWPCHDIQDPKQLAAAGLYYAGFGDCVRCFHCGLGLRNWMYGDSPWDEHARLSGHCDFLLEQMGQDFVLRHQASPSLKDESSYCQSSLNTTTSKQGLKKLPKVNGVARSPEAKRPNGYDACAIGPNRFDSSHGNIGASCSVSVSHVLEMGYTADTVQKAVSELRGRKGNEFTAVDIVETILAGESPTQSRRPGRVDRPPSSQSEPPPSEPPSSQPPSSQPRQANSGEKGTPKLSKQQRKVDITKPSTSGVPINQGSPSMTQEDRKSIAEENRQLHQQLVCKICMDKDACVVFLPCGHMVSCPECAPALRNCAVCRKRIKGTVKAFMS